MVVRVWAGPGLAQAVPDLQSPPVSRSRPEVPPSPPSLPEPRGRLHHGQHREDQAGAGEDQKDGVRQGSLLRGAG